ncbi:gene transfer agent family protein [Antarcticirhabdus aurantiaca]|uniref:Gene transfer agent family protein n=1 Tax=Antarcticirhabdus aurantiaca TaxID=2606717 RepID=A0ACD4NHM2_9HYPH|nr:gene transfer agent family protein [Jeongeuplla avenae]
MREAPSHIVFFGDGEKRFSLTLELIAELERLSGRGIGGLCRSLFAGDFHHAEVLQTIRLALIGGGTDPEEAAALVATYAAPRPVMEPYALAVAILETVMFGAAKKEPSDA